jgi:hypothetical protein
MKKLIILLLFVSLFNLNSETKFIKTRICLTFKQKDVSSEKVKMLKQNEKINIIPINKDWSYINEYNAYIQNLFLSDEISIQKTSVSEGLLSNVQVRKRASTFFLSAAAIRGLVTDDIRSRNNLKFKNYDFESIKFIEIFSYTIDELIIFIEEEFK